MAYTLNWANPNEAPIVIQPGTVDNSTSLTLTGKGYLNYGQEQQTDLILLLANFANTTPPPNPVQGQLWYNTTTLTMMSWNGVRWSALGTGGVTASIAVGATTATSAALTASATGGVTPYTYAWSVVNGPITGLSVTATGSTASILYTGTTATQTAQIQVVVTDANGTQGTATTPTLTFTATPLSATISPGTATHSAAPFAVSATGGVAPYTYAWSIVGTDANVNLSSTTGASTTLNFTGSANDSGTLKCIVTDHNGTTFNVTSPYSFSIITLSVNISDAGPTTNTSEVFTPTVTGGTGPYTYAWSLSGTSSVQNNGEVALNSLTGSTATVSLITTAPVSFGVFLKVTDSVGNTGSSNVVSSFNVAQAQPPSVGVSLIVSGSTSETWRANVTGGSGSYTYAWSISPPVSQISLGATTNQNATATYSGSGNSGNYTIYVTVTDSVSGLSTSANATGSFAATYSAPTVNITAGTTSATLETWNASVTGGSGNYTYAWSIPSPPSGVTLNSPSGVGSTSVSYSGSVTVSYNLFLVVTDTTSGLQSGNIGVTGTFTAAAQESITLTPLAIATGTQWTLTIANGPATGAVTLTDSFNGGAPDSPIALGSLNSSGNGTFHGTAGWSGAGQTTDLVTIYINGVNSATFTFTNATVYASPTITVNPTTYSSGGQRSVTISNAAPNAAVTYNEISEPSGVVQNNVAFGTTDSSGNFVRSGPTGNWGNQTSELVTWFVGGVQIGSQFTLTNATPGPVNVSAALGATTNTSAAYSASASGGLAPYTYAWSVVGSTPSGITLTPSGASASVSYSGTAGTALTIQVIATDTNLVSSTAATVAHTFPASLSATMGTNINGANTTSASMAITASDGYVETTQPTYGAGEGATILNHLYVTGGSGSYSYAWSYSGNNATVYGEGGSQSFNSAEADFYFYPPSGSTIANVQGATASFTSSVTLTCTATDTANSSLTVTRSANISVTFNCTNQITSITCFPAGSLVLMGDYSWKPIENIGSGDLVMGMDGLPQPILGMHKPILGSRRIMKFSDSSLSWSEEHAIWTKSTIDNTQWWWSYNAPLWVSEANSGRIGGLLDNSTMRSGETGVEWANVEGWKSNTIEIDSTVTEPTTKLYLPITRGSPIIVNGYAVGAGVDQRGYDYTKLDFETVMSTLSASEKYTPPAV